MTARVTLLDEFFSSRPYRPDPFQVEAAEAVSSGMSVVVTAPTGSGKTLIAEAAVHLARASGRRAFYTTPIKALSNQKYGDLVAEHGSEAVGLLTGDNVVNGGAPIVVMTTEVLRNMIYAGDRGLRDVGVVVLDEVHYLQDPFRGAVWEEVIIHAPHHIQLVCLSATIANAAEFAGWVEERRGPTRLVVAGERPVPLEGMYLVRDRYGAERLKLFPTFVARDGRVRPNPQIERLLAMEQGARRRFSTPSRIEVVERLADEDMLPAIYFIFSRSGCDAAATSMLDAGLRLTGPGERERIREVAERRTAHLSDADLSALDYGRWLAQLEIGVAAHHAGMVPAFKETVEELFAGGLLRVVFATETLALGINMPARSVVLDALSKFNGESHEMLQPGDYTQLTGRAGRRGIDVRGYGVVLHSRYVRFDQVARIASIGSHPLRSSFRPTYNMAANLVANYGEQEAEVLLTASFAQYLREGSQAGAERMLAEMEERLQVEVERSTCELGSVEEYVAMLDRQGSARAANLAGRLHPGDVVDIPGGNREGRFVVIRRLARGSKGMRVLAMSTSGRTVNLGAREFVAGSERIGTIELPPGNDRTGGRRFQQDLLRRLRRIPDAPLPSGSEETEVRHPVAGCPRAEQHVTWARRAERTRRRIVELRDRLRSEGVGLVEEFRAIERLLEGWGYLDGWSLTGRGRRLRFVYNELDLLLTEALERGLFWSLQPAELAALASCFVYEPRTDQPSEIVWPTATLAGRWADIELLAKELERAERDARLPLTRRPDPGFVELAFRWASAGDLEELPHRAGIAAGDFVRISRQLVDLVRQLRDVAPEIADEARTALRAIDRGVVAAQGVA